MKENLGQFELNRGPEVYLTVDVEPDCPPYLWTWRGIEEGMPKLLELFRQEGVSVTFFTTGQTAKNYPSCIDQIVDNSHELACHGYTHTSFQTMTMKQAAQEISDTNDLLRKFAEVTSFRAPYLRFPEEFVCLLRDNGIRTDSSRARYKFTETRTTQHDDILRLEASVTSSVLRLPEFIRDPWFGMLKQPITLFVHPWEFVDLSDTSIRYDCRFRTGQTALDCFRSTIRFFKKRNAVFRTVNCFNQTS